VTLLIAALGTDRARAFATACPLPVEADMRHLDRAPLLSSRAEEFHLRALPDTYVNLSIHTAPDVRPLP